MFSEESGDLIGGRMTDVPTVIREAEERIASGRSGHRSPDDRPRFVKRPVDLSRVVDFGNRDGAQSPAFGAPYGDRVEVRPHVNTF
jgi:hypothetical protein